MVKKLHYQVCFKSKDGNTYAINMYKESDSFPTLRQLRPADDPFTTFEKSDRDVFSPIRGQSGYIRILLRKGTDDALLDELIPTNNHQTLVRVYKGTYSGTWPNGTFIGGASDSNLVWQGYLKAEEYTQPWTDTINLLELPVASMLETLRSVYFPQGASRLIPLREVVTMAVDALYDYTRVWNTICIKSDWISQYNIFWQVYMQYMNAQNAVTYISVLNEKTTIYKGKSYYDILKSIAELFGLTIREDGMMLYFEQIQMRSTAAGKLFTINSFDSSTIPTSTGLAWTEKGLTMPFARTTNTKSMINGLRSAKVSLQLDIKDVNAISLPESIEDTTPTNEIEVYKPASPMGYPDYRLVIQAPERPVEVTATYGGRLYNAEANDGGAYVFRPCPDMNTRGYAQSNPMSAPTNNHIQIEDLDSGDIIWIDAQDKDAVIYDPYTYIWNGTRWVDMYEYPTLEEQFLKTSIFRDPLSYVGFRPYTTIAGVHVDYPADTTVWIRYGAWPVRFFLGARNSEIKLSHGVFFNLDADQTMAEAMLAVKSPISYANAGDYINLNFLLHYFNTKHVGHTTTVPSPGGYTQEWVWDMDQWRVDNYDDISGHTLTLYFKLRFGDKWWNGSAWQASETKFTLAFVNSKMPENYDPAMLVSDIGGYYIPIDNSLSGVVELSFMGCNTHSATGMGEPSDEPHAAIVEKFSFMFMRKTQPTATTVEENNYYTEINAEGFTEEKEINLELGTDFNNSNSAMNLIVDSNNEKIGAITYNDGSSQRPEQHLLDQVGDYYSKPRKVYTGWLKRTIANAINWMTTIITYGGKFFYGIIKQKNWREGTEEIQLIETFNPDES